MCGFPRATRGWHVFPLRSKGGLTPSNQPSAEEKPEKPALLAGQAQIPHVKEPCSVNLASWLFHFHNSLLQGGDAVNHFIQLESWSMRPLQAASEALMAPAKVPSS